MSPESKTCCPRSNGIAATWWLVATAGMACAGLAMGGSFEVSPIPDPLRREFNLDPFYQKHLLVGGLPVVGSDRASAFALREAAWIVGHLLEDRDEILRGMGTNKTRLAVMAWNEFTTDIPEHSGLEPKVYWDRRARGLGATSQRPAV